jgi:hypothetical protein
MTQENHEIAYEQLVDVAEERLSEEVNAELLRRMDSKKLAEVASLKKIISLMRQDASESAPAPLLQRIFRLFSEQHARKAHKPLLKRLFAALKFDSFVGSPAYGVRAERRETRHLLFEAGRHELDIRITPAEGGVMVAGQVLGPGAGGTVELRTSEHVEIAQLNAMLEFSLPVVPAGKYEMIFQIPDVEVVISEIELQAA